MIKSFEMSLVIGVVLALLGLGVLAGPRGIDGEPSPTEGPAPSHGLAWND